MRFKFSKNLDYQIEATQAIVGIFESGQNLAINNNNFTLQSVDQIIANELDMDQTAVSHNLARLKKCGFVVDEAEGKYHYY